MTFNILLSGVSVSGHLTTEAANLKVEMGASDKIGHASFVLENTTGLYSTMLLSGNQACEVDVVKNGVTTVLWRGTVERAEPQIDAKQGSVCVVDAYDYGRELLNVVSPDGRAPYLLATSGAVGWTGTGVNILSGDGGISSPAGMDLVYYTSGAQGASGANVSQFMAQWFGVSGDHAGSMSGSMLSFKPYVSGYTWKTWYMPDASGGVLANDKNVNFTLPLEKVKAKHEYAWDALRKITRQQVAIDSAGNPVSFELYVGNSGDIHIFASGSYEILSSGLLVYYAAGQSGAQNNNVVSAKVPYDLTAMKNYVDGWFPDWTQYPIGDLWCDWIAYSGGYWSGINPSNGSYSGVVLSGAYPASPVGQISIQAQAISGNAPSQGNFSVIFTLFSGTVVNLNNFNVAPQASGGYGYGVYLTYALYLSTLGSYPTLAPPNRIVALFDTSGRVIIKSGTATNINGFAIVNIQSGGGWTSVQDVIFGSGGIFASGTGNDGKWFVSGPTSPAFSSSGFDLSNVKQIQLGINYGSQGSVLPAQPLMAIDNLGFTFDYPISPVVAFNSGSQGLYGRRYAVVEWPYQVSAAGASGVIQSELNNRMGSQGLSTFVIRDNPAQTISPQLAIKPGYVFVVDAPSLATGSGQPFYYWRATDVVHSYSKKDGWETTIKAYPWYSGAVASPLNNNVNYKTPHLYGVMAPQPHETHAPVARPWHGPSG